MQFSFAAAAKSRVVGFIMQGFFSRKVAKGGGGGQNQGFGFSGGGAKH